MTETMIETRGLTKRYGRRTLALDGLTLDVTKGEVLGFLGPNGAGKTTTIRLLLDLIRPTSGEIRLFGLDSRRDGLETRRRIGYLPGELPFEGRQNGWELLTFLGNLRGGVGHRHIRALAERFELDLDQPIRTLSKGNKQKVGLVQAFMHEPELLILDEPSSGLDPLLQREFLDLVREVRNEGRTVFMSSHILAEVEDIADRVAILREGSLVAVEDIHSLKQRAVRRMEILFDGPVPPEEFSIIPGVRDVKVDGNTLSCTVEGPADALIKAAARFAVISVLSRAPDLEDAFLEYYSDERGG